MIFEEKCFGVMLDGPVEIGKFSIITDDELERKKIVNNIIINKNYFDLTALKSKKLSFKFVKEIDIKKYIQIEDYGYGYLYAATNVWYDNRNVNILKANYKNVKIFKNNDEFFKIN